MAYDLPEVQPVQNYATEEDLAKSTYAADAAKEAKDYIRRVETAKYHNPPLYEIYSIEDPETRQRALDEYNDFSFFRDVFPFIPINAKQYIYHMMGGKGDLDINDLTKKEQEAYYRYAQELIASGELPLDQDSSAMMDYPNYGTKSDYGDVYWGKKNLGLSDEKLEAWKKGEINIAYPGGRDGAIETYSYDEWLEKFPGTLDVGGQSIGDLITNMQDPNYVAKTLTGKADINYDKDSNTITVTDKYNHNRNSKATTKTIIEAFMADPSLYAALKAGALLKNADGSIIELDLGSPEFVKNYPTGMYNGGEASYLQSALDMLAQSAPVTEAPPGTFDLGSIEPFNPIMERYQPNPLDEFAMMMADPTKKLKVISTPVKMQLKPLFAKRNKFKQLIDKQKFNYERGQDLASKTDPDAIDQGTYMMNAAIKSGKRFQQQLNDIEEKIRKIYQSK